MRPLIGTPLKRFLKQYRRANQPNVSLSFILQSVEYPTNVGSIFRLADGIGVDEVILTGITPQPPNPTIDKVSRHKHQRIDWRYVKDPVEAVRQQKARGYQIVAVEIAEGATPYHKTVFSDKVCLVVGHEDHGVTKAILGVCDSAVFIPMYGKGLSLNVHVALSIAAYRVLHP